MPLPPIFTTNVPWHKMSVCTNEEAEVIIVEGISKITSVNQKSVFGSNYALMIKDLV